jgi:hypothetical protein
MERSWIGRTALVMMSALWLGCGTPCENARTRIEGRYAECGIEIAKPEDPPENEVCSDGDAEYQKCVANCTNSASCEALNGQDAMAGADFGECLGDCAN